jgi:hypothetical protein
VVVARFKQVNARVHQTVTLKKLPFAKGKFRMLNQNRRLQAENDSLQEQNTRLAHFIALAERRVKDLSGSLQRNHVNVMPTITTCEDLVKPASEPQDDNVSLLFAKAGQVKLTSPATTLADGTFLAAGESKGQISLWSIDKSIAFPSGSRYRYSSNSSRPSSPSPAVSPISNTREPLTGHTDLVTSVTWHDSRHLSSVSLDGTLRLWDIESSSSDSFSLNIPAVSHSVLDSSIIIATCTRRILQIDPRDPRPTVTQSDSIITSIEHTRLGLVQGTATGDLLLLDSRINKTYQTLRASPGRLAISRISGYENPTVTAFDGYVRLLGAELPMFIEKEYARAAISGAIIGSCALPLVARDDFVISGSAGGNAIVWTSSNTVAMLGHKGQVVSDCVPLKAFVGSFATCDSAATLTVWTRSFDRATT